MADHPLADGMVQSAWSQPAALGPPAAVPDGLEGLAMLAAQGNYRELAQRCRAANAAAGDALSIAAFHSLALVRLRLFTDAAAELARLGSRLEDPAAPFALRVMHADLPWQQGRHGEGLDRLHALLAHCERRLAAAAAGSPDQQLWRRRRRDALLRAANRHCRLRQHTAALRLLNRLLASDTADAEAWAEAGAVMCLLGDLSGAQHTLRHAEQLLLQVPGGGGGIDQQRRKALAHRSRGLLLYLQHDYRGARDAFSAALAADPADSAAASNRALCLLASGQLGDASAALERAFLERPGPMMLVGAGGG